MPLGKKKNKEEKQSLPPGGAGYPMQGGYPSQPAVPQPNQMYHNTAFLPGAPPPYAAAAAPPPAYGQPQAGYGPPPPGYGPPPGQQGYPGYPQPQQGYAQPPPVQQHRPPPGNTTVVLKGGFDAGARFDGVSQPNVPPPPPGCAPNAAQMGMARGNNVVVTQRQGNFWEGGSDGGYVMF